MKDLPDVNVWLALVDENHAHHLAARDYWQFQAAPAVAFCRVSMLGFLRLATHRGVLSRPLVPAEAWGIYQSYRNGMQVGFVHEPPLLDDEFRRLSSGPDFAPHLWTDACLAAMAIGTGCRVVSFDADFKRFAGLDFLHLSPARSD